MRWLNLSRSSSPFRIRALLRSGPVGFRAPTESALARIGDIQSPYSELAMYSTKCYIGHQERKSGGFRTLVATNKGNKWFFVFGFPKNLRSNIDKDEEVALKKLASHLLSLSATALIAAQNASELIKVNCDAQNQVSNS
jgi:hypothetical protein